MRVRIAVALLALAAGCGTGATPAQSATPALSSPPASSSGTAQKVENQPLWPFSDPQQVRNWQRSYRTGGHSPWHVDAAFTAVAFTQGYLGFTELDQAIKTDIHGGDAFVQVGFSPQEGEKPQVAATVHLIKYGSGPDTPWEVVGAESSDITIKAPEYGTAAESPVMVAGTVNRTAGNVQILFYQPGHEKPIAESRAIPVAGSWQTTVPFTAQTDQVITVVAATGGHVADVERFAVTAITP
ncbi:hypothetical protein ACIBHX_28760 [Nonomuraea sp. NPDC050536]|uniref:hypothetical protein n=1 Tax=Nonomuraea sp. NPDC050536 TaxID=3364366 RepID=UPI0037CB3EA8